MQVSTSTPPIVSIDLSPNTINFYETAIDTDDTIATNYWYLGVAYLLAGREEDAQAAWFTPFAIANEIEVDNLTNYLIEILEQAANHQFEILDLEQAWLLRQHIWTLAPDRLENVFHLVYLANRLGTLTATSLTEWQVNEVLEVNTIESIDEVLLERTIGSLVTIRSDLSLEIIKSCLNRITSNRELLISKLIATLFQVFNQQDPSLFIVEIVKTCNEIQPNTLGTIQVLNYVCSGVGLYAEAIIAAEEYFKLASGIIERLFGSYQIQRTHFTAGNWQNVDKRVYLHRQLLAEAIQISPQNLSRSQYQTLIIPSFFLPYIEDNPHINKPLQNQLATIYQQNIQPIIAEEKVEKPSLKKKVGCLRIGYIGCTLRSHSVGWLSRWLMHHHDRESFQIFIYCLNISKDNNFNHQWFRNKVDVTSYLNGSVEEIISQIRADEIDILIDLDSLTYDITCLVMAYKTAPIQISWLGWDSSGIPAIDYFIADPYVLPNDAQDYYSEKIWRLPQTYLAVEGFEIGIPTLRREDLDIPADAVVYLSGQSG